MAIYSLYPCKCKIIKNIYYNVTFFAIMNIFCDIRMRRMQSFNTSRPRQNGRHFPNDILKCIFLNENVWISIKISLKFVLKGPITNIAALVQIMAWRRPGDKPLSEPMMESFLTHICVTRPQWVKINNGSYNGWVWSAIPWAIIDSDGCYHMYTTAKTRGVQISRIIVSSFLSPNSM